MGLIHIMERGGDDYREYKKAVKKAKEAIDTICELTEDMEEEFGYKERNESYMRGSYRRDGEWGEMPERRGRDSMGRYR